MCLLLLLGTWLVRAEALEAPRPATVSERSLAGSREAISVSARDNFVSIDADNAPITDLLREIERVTGTAFVIPPDAWQRLSVHIVKYAAKDALMLLLDKSAAYDYVLLMSTEFPQRVERVFMSPRAPSGRASGSSTSPLPEQQVRPVAVPDTAIKSPVHVPNEQEERARQWQLDACHIQGCDAS